jgi:hypothetical protein
MMMQSIQDTDMLIRNPGVVVVRSKDQYALIVPKPQCAELVFQKRAGNMIERMLATLIVPSTATNLQSKFPELTAEQFTALLTKLIENRVILSLQKPESNLEQNLEQSQERMVRRLLVGVCGGVEASRLSLYLDPLFYSVASELQIIITESARHFVNVESLAQQYGTIPWVDLFELRNGIPAPHIYLADWVDVTVVIPATAHLLHRLATGSCSDLLSLVITATRAPVVLLPSMNHNMWFHPSVQRNVQQVVADGIHVVSPGPGREVSEGRHAEFTVGGVGLCPDDLPIVIRSILSSRHHSQEAQQSQC